MVHPLRVGLVPVENGSALVGGLRAGVHVHGVGGHEAVGPDVSVQQNGRVPHPLRQVTVHVDDGIPLAAGQRPQITAVAVTRAMLHLREQRRVAPAAVEQRHIQAGVQRSVDDGTSNKPGSTQHENSHHVGLSSFQGLAQAGPVTVSESCAGGSPAHPAERDRARLRSADCIVPIAPNLIIGKDGRHDRSGIRRCRGRRANHPPSGPRLAAVALPGAPRRRCQQRRRRVGRRTGGRPSWDRRDADSWTIQTWTSSSWQRPTRCMRKSRSTCAGQVNVRCWSRSRSPDPR